MAGEVGKMPDLPEKRLAQQQRDLNISRMERAQKNVVQETILQAAKSGQIPRGGFTSAEAFAEAEVGKTLTPEEKRTVAKMQNTAWATASPKIQQEAITQAGAASSDRGIPWSTSYANHPGIALAAAKAVGYGTLNRNQLKTLNAVVEIVDTAQQLLTAYSDVTREHILAKLPQARQVAVMQAAVVMAEEFQALQAATMTQSGDQSPILQALGKAGSLVIDGFNWLSERGQHLGRTWQRTWTTGHDPIQSWQETAVGNFDSGALNDLRSEYGDQMVSVVQDVVAAQQHNDDFTWSDLIAKYENDQNALNIVDGVLLQSERDRIPGLETLLGRMNAARVDNLGGMIANNLLPEDLEGTSPLWSGTSKSLNVVTLLALDPTLAAGKAYRGYQSFRYGLARAYGAGSLEKVFSNPGSARFFSSVADDIMRYNAANDVASAGKIAGEMKIKYGKYLTDDAIDSLASYVKVEGKSGITDTGSFVQKWLNDMDGYNKLLSGQAARRPGDRVVPRMTAAREKVINARLKAREFIAFDDSTDAMNNAIIGADLDSVTAASYRALGIDPKTASAQSVADMLQDPSVQYRLVNEFGLEPNSWATRLITRQPSQRTVRNRFDKVFRQFELMPRGLQIKIDTADDAQKVYQFARTTFSKSLSETLRETWKYATPGERRLMLNGMFDTIAGARGIDLDQVLENGMKLRDAVLTSGSRGMEQYAATVGGFEAIPFGTPLAQYSQRLTRAVLPKLDDDARGRVNAINARLAGLFEEQTVLKQQASSLQEDLDAKIAARNAMKQVDDSINAEIDQLESYIKFVQKEGGKKWGAASALLKERKALRETPDAFAYNPAEVAGKQHAVHLHQMASSVTVPDFAALQRYQQRSGVLGKIVGSALYSPGATTFVDTWSAFNLVSPRYVMRNAPEDWLGYILSGGNLESAIKGRMLSTTYRELRGRKLGIVEESMRVAADKQRLLGQWFLNHMPEDDVRAFLDAVKNGDAAIAEGIAGTAFARIQANAAGKMFDEVDEALFKTFASTPDASRLVDDVAEIRGGINNGRLVSSADSGVAPQMRADLRDLRLQKPGEYTNVPFDHLDTDAYVAWHDMLTNILHNDGRPGQIVFKAMNYADKHKGGLVSAGWEKYKDELVAFFSDEDLAAEWWSKSSMLQQVGPEEFARRYFDAASNYFSHEGVVSGNLVRSLTQTSETGAKFGGLYKSVNGQIEKSSLFTVDNLRQFGRYERPQYILGKTLKTVGGTDDLRKLDQAFGYLGESLARISREPLYFANVLDEWRAAQPQITRMVADGLSEEAARKIVLEQVMDRAKQMTISYIDNPDVRTQLAFNARNVARYYRATEDFYRRAVRLSTYRPDQMQKLNLVYQNMNNSGFIWSDDQGTQYFIYPGTGVVNQAVTKAMSIFGALPSITNPFVFGGQTLMLTPSSDPTSLLPTFASPLIAPPVKALTALAPFKWLEPVLLGSRGTQPTGTARDLMFEIATSALPAPLTRIWSLMDPRERDTQLTSATISAMRYAEYAGSLDQKKGESDEAFKARVKQNLGTMAMATLGLRFLFGFMAPASPQLLSDDDLTVEARKMGLKSLRSGYTQLLNKYKGDYDRATAEWFKINPDLFPYTVAGTEAKGQGYPSMTSESGKWLIKNSEFVTKHPSAAPFLTPNVGEFSFSTYGLAKSLGMIQGKTVDQAWLEIATQRDYYSYMETKNDADAAIAAEQYPAMRNQYRQQWAELKQQMFTENPFLETRVNTIKQQSNLALKKSALQDMRLALKDIYGNRKDLVTDRTNKIMSMINTFDDGMAAVNRFGGNTDYALEQRKATRTQLRQILQNIAGDDRGATDFYDRILDPQIG